MPTISKKNWMNTITKEMIRMIGMLKKLMLAKRKNLSYISMSCSNYFLTNHEPSEALETLRKETLQDLRHITHQYIEELVELMQLTDIEDVINRYFEDNLEDEERNLDVYYQIFTEINRLQSSLAQHSLLYADYIQEELYDD